MPSAMLHKQLAFLCNAEKMCTLKTSYRVLILTIKTSEKQTNYQSELLSNYKQPSSIELELTLFTR